MRYLPTLLLLAILSLGLSGTAHAMKNDLTLWRFCERNSSDGWCLPDLSIGTGTRVKADNAKFKSFMKGFSSLIAPKFMAPSGSLGWAGWNLGVEYSLNHIPGGNAWDDALEGVERIGTARAAYDGDKSAGAPDNLHTVQLHVRKGLPFSAEIGATGTYILQSKMFALGFEGKYTVLEGYEKAPDVAVRMTYTRLFGAPDLDLDLLGWDLSLSKDFGLGGFVQLAPYTGYSLVYALGKPHVVNASFSSDNTGRLLDLKNQNVVVHRWFLGARLVASSFSFAPEIMLSSARVYQFTMNLGAEL